MKRIAKEFFDVRPGEGAKTLGLALFFFLVIAVFWVLKPIKRGLMIDFYGEANAGFDLFGFVLSGAQTEQLGKVVNMVVAYFVVIGFTLLVRRLERQQVVYVFAGLLAALLAIFALSISAPDAATVWTFYVFGDLFNTIMVATFWAFTADVILPQQSRRLYGLIGLGGVVGGFVGASLVSGYVEEIGRAPFLWASVGAMGVIAAVAYFVNRQSDPAARPGTGDEAAASGATTSAAFEGAKLVFRSRYLLGIMVLLGLYELVSNVIDFQLAATIEASGLQGRELDAIFGFVGQLVGVGSIVVQLFVTTFVLRRYGVGTALLFLPVAVLISSVGFLVVPVLGFAIAMSVSDNGLNYSINQSAREALYTPTTPDEKYKAKAFIDMFVQRFAKVLAVAINLGVTAFAGLAGVRWLSVVSLVVLVGWLAVVRFLGRRFEEKAGA